jgi:hypothetical protein
VHQHLGDVGAMRLILGQIQNQLHGAADAEGVFRHEQRALPFRDAIRHATPEGHRLVARHRLHEADRRAAFDAIDQHVGQPPDDCVVDRGETPDRPRLRHRRPPSSDAKTTA